METGFNPPPEEDMATYPEEETLPYSSPEFDRTLPKEFDTSPNYFAMPPFHSVNSVGSPMYGQFRNPNDMQATPHYIPQSVRAAPPPLGTTGSFQFHFSDGGWTPMGAASTRAAPIPPSYGSLMQYLDIDHNQGHGAAAISSPVSVQAVENSVDPPGFPPEATRQHERNAGHSTPSHDTFQQHAFWPQPPSFPDWSEGYPIWSKSFSGTLTPSYAMPSPIVGPPMTPFHAMSMPLHEEVTPIAPKDVTSATPKPLDAVKDPWFNVAELPALKPIPLTMPAGEVTGTAGDLPPVPTPTALAPNQEIDFEETSDVPTGLAMRVTTPGGMTAKSHGSAQHPNDCRPCAFFWTKGCINGSDCRFCHEWHPPKKKKPMKEQKNLMIIARPDGKIEFMRCTVSEALRVL